MQDCKNCNIAKACVVKQTVLAILVRGVMMCEYDTVMK
jgi:hypothetical protein